MENTTMKYSGIPLSHRDGNFRDTVHKNNYIPNWAMARAIQWLCKHSVQLWLNCIAKLAIANRMDRVWWRKWKKIYKIFFMNEMVVSNILSHNFRSDQHDGQVNGCDHYGGRWWIHEKPSAGTFICTKFIRNIWLKRWTNNIITWKLQCPFIIVSHSMQQCRWILHIFRSVARIKVK